MRRFLLAITLSVFALTSVVRAQGVPTFDGTQLTQLVSVLAKPSYVGAPCD